MSFVAVSIAAVGAGIAAYGAISSANDQSDLDKNRAHVAQQQAEEIAAREFINEQNRNQEAYRQKLQVGTASAGAGKAGTSIGTQLEVQRQTDLANMTSSRDSAFQEQMLYEQGAIDTNLASETQTAGTIAAAGSVLQGASSAYSAANPRPTTVNYNIGGTG